MSRAALVVSTVHTPLDARIHFRQIRALLADGWRVTQVGAWSARGIDPPDLGPDFRTVDVPRSAGRRRIAGFRAARRALRALGPDHDVVLIHDPELLPAAAGLELPPVVWDVHEDTAAATIDKDWLPAALRPAARAAVSLLERLAERYLRLILAEDGYVERFRHPHPVVHNYPWVPEDPPVPVSDDDRPEVVYLGRIALSRGSRPLLEVAARVSDRVDVRLIGPADAEVEPHVRAAVDAGHVTWDGFVPNETALSSIGGALAGLSLMEPQPNHLVSLQTKVVEYAGRGVPVITTAIPAAAAFVREGDCGVAVDFGDAAAVEEAIDRLLQDRDEARAMGRRGWELARARYDWTAEGRRFAQLLADWADTR